MDKINKKLLDKCFENDIISYTTPPPINALVVFNESNSCFIVDDGCYVLCNHIRDNWVQSTHIFKEALEHLKRLPSDPREAKTSWK